jgi:RNA polymerase sigma-70 factor (ECF subfamily)
MLTDEQLLTDYAMTGSNATFAELVRRFERPLFAFLRHWVRNTETIRDRIQDTFLKIHRHAGKFRGECKASVWIFTIAKNAAIASGQKCMNKREKQMDDSTGFRFVSGNYPTPDDVLAESEEMAHVIRIVESIGTRNAAVIRLLDLEGMSEAEAAEQLHIPIGTIKSRRHRAIKKLRKLMDA